MASVISETWDEGRAPRQRQREKGTATLPKASQSYRSPGRCRVCRPAALARWRRTQLGLVGCAHGDGDRKSQLVSLARRDCPPALHLSCLSRSVEIIPDASHHARGHDFPGEVDADFQDGDSAREWAGHGIETWIDSTTSRGSGIEAAHSAELAKSDRTTQPHDDRSQFRWPVTLSSQ